MYRKKTVLLCSVANPSQKPVGIAVFVSDGQKTSVRVSASGLSSQNFWFVAETDGVAVSEQVSKSYSFEFKMPSTLLEKVSCLLMDSRLTPWCFGSSRGHVLTAEFTEKARLLCKSGTVSETSEINTAAEICLQKNEDGLTREFFNLKPDAKGDRQDSAPVEAVTETETPAEPFAVTATSSAGAQLPLLLDFDGDYDKFVVATGNYYSDRFERTEDIASTKEAKVSLKQYAKALENYYDKSNAGGYLKNVSNELEKVFEDYQPYLPLMRKIQDSFFVKITDGKGNFFALGLLQEDGKPTHICYALPITSKSKEENPFLTVSVKDGEKNIDFCLIMQSAEDGKVFRAQ